MVQGMDLVKDTGPQVERGCTRGRWPREGVETKQTRKVSVTGSTWAGQWRPSRAGRAPCADGCTHTEDDGTGILRIREAEKDTAKSKSKKTRMNPAVPNWNLAINVDWWLQCTHANVCMRVHTQSP